MTNSTAKTLVLKEYLARQIFWVTKENPELKNKLKCPNFLDKFVYASRISNQFMLVNLEIAKLLLDEGVKKILDKRFGLLDEETTKLFRGRLSHFEKEAAADWRTLIMELGLEKEIHSDDVMTRYIIEAFGIAKNKGY